VLGQGADLEERLANTSMWEDLFIPAYAYSCVRPFGSRVHLSHASARSNRRPFRPVPDVTSIRAQTRVLTAMATRNSPSVRVRTPYLQLCARSLVYAKSPHAVPRIRACSPCPVPHIRACSPHPVPRIRTWNPRPAYLSAPIPCPAHPSVPILPICAPSLITLLLSIMAFNYTCS
jgi:hypothetical protein